MDSEENRKRSEENEEEEERRKQASRGVPFNVLDQVHSDFAMAMALQDQDRAFTGITSIESESQDDEEEESDEASSYENNDDDYEFSFEGHDLEAGDLEFLEGQDSNSDQDMEGEEDEIDPDELSYEELIALGEFIGEEKRGLTLSEIASCLRPYKYQSLGCKAGTDRCVICQDEYEEGESLAALPYCEHPYHSECISNWLQVKKTCPICSTEVSSSPTS